MGRWVVERLGKVIGKKKKKISFTSTLDPTRYSPPLEYDLVCVCVCPFEFNVLKHEPKFEEIVSRMIFHHV